MNINSPRLLFGFCLQNRASKFSFRFVQNKAWSNYYYGGSLRHFSMFGLKSGPNPAVSSCRLLDTSKRYHPNQMTTGIREMRLWNEKTLRVMYWRKKRFDVTPEKQRPRSAWQDWDYPSELFAFAQRLQESSLTEEILTKMFTHRSFVEMQQRKREELGIHEVDFVGQDNAELIEQGRQIAEPFIKRYLRYHLRDVPEECIQSVSGHLMSHHVLSDISKWIGCIDLINCAEFPPNQQTLAETVLAVVASIANVSGLKRAHNFLIDFVLTYLNGSDLMEIWDVASLDLDLNTVLRAKGLPQYEPRILFQSCPGTFEACYVVGLYCDQKLVGQGPGESASIAKKMAQLDTVRNLFRLNTSQIRFKFGPQAYDIDLSKFDREYFSLESACSGSIHHRTTTSQLTN